MAAQPLSRGERNGKREYARRATHPYEPCGGNADRSVDRQHGRQPADGHRQQPAKRLGVDEKGVADPIKAGQEVAEAEAPAGAGGAPNADLRHRQGRCNAGKESEKSALPTRGKHNRMGNARDQRHGRRGPAGVPASFGASSSGSAGGVVPASTASGSRLRGGSPRGRSRRSFSRTMRTRLTRRGSASSTSNSNRPGPVTISPRTGKRPARVTR